MRIVPVPVHQDNYAYLLIDPATGEAAAVDPAQVPPILEAAEREKVNITTILTTHHHWDHADGNTELVTRLQAEEHHRETPVLVVGGDKRIPELTREFAHDEELALGTLRIRVLKTPGHTLGHVLYYVTDTVSPEQPGALFTGDTLFIGGCGRFFEGTPAQMHHALNTVVRSLPESTEVWCGHEYTVANLSFALTVEPHNAVLQEKLKWAIAQREAGKCTIPSTIGDELAFNPFMRVEQASVREGLYNEYGVDGLKEASDEEVMKWLRLCKNDGKAAALKQKTKK
eukprot:CAMPEP_0177663488 /NCGR_PEP_ID=MMETSP0447-20121125/19942_1 /TAXON_ID=0 /ORGANISM="Stygamoeba regulata, Strain BSH-02190019" /LENGTH=284 /DNA_ID=CAMNT_0019169307 /DNA_START=250 /DNA_END=1104 /DNA_ORIENTATION=-